MNESIPPADKPDLIDACQPGPAAAEHRAAWQRELRDQTGPFRGAFEHAAIGMAIVDLDGRFLKVNRSLCHIVGYSEAELLAFDFQSITHPDDLESDVALVRKTLRGEIDHYHMEKRYLHKQGHTAWILLSVSLVRDDARQPCYFVSQIQDITARKLAERESARRLRHVERLTRTASRILHALEGDSDATTYPRVLRIAIDSFQSKIGWFLRFDDEDTLVGPYGSTTESHETRCQRADFPNLWHSAFDQKAVLVSNAPSDGGRESSRALAGPILYNGIPLGLLHVGGSDVDYDEDDRDLLMWVCDLIAPALHARMEFTKLTPREAEVMDLIVSGKSQKQIATTLNITVQTAAKHRSRVLDKLDVTNDVELVHLAWKMRSVGGLQPGAHVPPMHGIPSDKLARKSRP